MTTYEVWKDGKCSTVRPLRVKVWDSGFSIKCFGGTKKTLVGRPFNAEFMRSDLKTFCDGCEKILVPGNRNEQASTKSDKETD